MAISNITTFPFLSADLWRHRKWRWQRKAQRFARAWRYMIGTYTVDDAEWISLEVDNKAGCWALQTISDQSVLEYARNRWEDHPELPRLAHEAAARVAKKWAGVDDVTAAAEDWALDLIADYAKSDGIPLTEID